MPWPSKDPADYRRNQPPGRRWPRDPEPSRWRRWLWPEPYAPVWLRAILICVPITAAAVIAEATGHEAVDGAFPWGFTAGYAATLLAEAYYRITTKRRIRGRTASR